MKFSLWINGLAVLLLAGCQTPDAPPIACEHRAECPPGWTCGASGTCIVAVDCTLDIECCPGMSCFNGHCEPDAACDTPAGCQAPDHACIGGLCRALPCQSDSACTAPARCVAGVCAVGDPCGACGPGEACVPDLGRCVPAVAACAETACDPGELRIVTNGAAITGDSCDLSHAACACAERPPLTPGVFGLWGKLIALGPWLLHASYDQTYGDVVVARYEASGSEAALLEGPIALDGLPDDAPVEGAKDGPRKGVAAPGPDVGRYVAAAGHGSFLYLAYRDDTHAALRFAVVKPDKGYASVAYTLSDTGDPGTHTAVAVDPAGIPRVASFLASHDGGTALGFWRASRANPGGPGDWEPVVLVEESSEPVDPAPDDGIASAPRGVGLFPSMAVTSDALTLIASYDSRSGALRLARVPYAGPPQVVTIDGAPSALAGGEATTLSDVGRHARLAILPSGAAAIAYQDSTDHALRYWSGPATGGGSVQVADDGAGHRVGAGIALALTGTGQPIIVHGDETTGDLLLTRRTANGWSTEILLGDGVQGMFPSAASVEGTLWLSALELAFPKDGRPLHVPRVFAAP